MIGGWWLVVIADLLPRPLGPLSRLELRGFPWMLCLSKLIIELMLKGTVAFPFS